MYVKPSLQSVVSEVASIDFWRHVYLMLFPRSWVKYQVVKYFLGVLDTVKHVGVTWNVQTRVFGRPEAFFNYRLFLIERCRVISAVGSTRPN